MIVGRAYVVVLGFIQGSYWGRGGVDKKVEFICFGTYNIQNGRNDGLG